MIETLDPPQSWDDPDGQEFEDATSAPTWERPRGALVRPNGKICIGRVGAPPRQEATSVEFYFWVPPDALVERTQLVTCESRIGSQDFTFYAMVDETYRCSRKRDMGTEVDENDSDLASEPPFASDGYTYARASILRVVPPVFTSPRERSDVLLAGPAEAALAYGADEIENPLRVGLIRNGGNAMAGPGTIDLDYLLGTNGGHMNVNGSAGRGTKSSFLLHVNWLLLREARGQARSRPSDPDRLRIVPIILNVKNFDLFHIDRPSRRYNVSAHANTWRELGVEDPEPFTSALFYAAQQSTSDLAVPTGRHGSVQPYSWSLRDAIAAALLPYLFVEADANDANFGALVLDIENFLTHEHIESAGTTSRNLRTDLSQPDTFKKLLDWVGSAASAKEEGRYLKNHHTSTWKKLHRRLLKLLYEGKGVLRMDDQCGNPLNLVRADTCDPIVVDLAALASQPDLQRFVVATILRQLIGMRTGSKAVRGLVYLITLDELNRFAPRGAHDAITQLVETVAAEMRSQGIILLGAQQQASKVSEKVIENASIRVLGRTGSLELGTQTWRFLSDSARHKAQDLTLDEKLIIQDNFREPMHIQVPFPAWAMNPSEAAHSVAAPGEPDDRNDIIDG